MNLKILIATLFLCIILYTNNVLSQGIDKLKYSNLLKKSDSLYAQKKYVEAANCYSEAFKIKGISKSNTTFYNAACTWAEAKNSDSAFFNLFKLTDSFGFNNYTKIKLDNDFNYLHSDKRFDILITKMKENLFSKTPIKYHHIIEQLDTIYSSDQLMRISLKEVRKMNGNNSLKEDSIKKIIRYLDTFNLNKVSQIIDSFGWLGTNEIGISGNSTLFLVIQHSNIKTMEKYFPRLKEAVNNKKAKASDLALMEDRILMGNFKKQKYGSQIQMNSETGKWELYPIEDEKNVEERRKSAGLQPLFEYLKNWNIVYIPIK